MSGLWIVIAAALFSIGPSDVPGDSKELMGPRVQTRRGILETSLKRFDEAVAFQDHRNPQARKKYREALDGFQTLIRDGVNNGHLYYNAANAQMRLGDIGQAIANYRRASRLLPNDANVRQNLEFARSLCEIQIPSPAADAVAETLFFWYFDTAPVARTRVALTAYMLCWLLLLGRLLLRRRFPVLAWTAMVTAIVALAAGGSVAWDMHITRNRTEGVIIADEAVLRKGNGESYQPQLDRPLPQGVEFKILEIREDVRANVWYRVELRDGKDGWLRADRAEVI
ncbi:MAG: hypothetical protein MI923_24070 [Phycisphaerales bacterium]|nr:hypothetical protein [Phycisphaerales bacterium]